jgi:hypothetical protein
MTIKLAIAAVTILTAHCAAIAQTPTPSFYGVKVDQALSASIPLCAKDKYGIIQSHQNYCTPDNSDYYGGLINNIQGPWKPDQAKMEVRQDKMGVIFVGLYFPQTEFETYKSALIAKYGQPTQTQDIPVQNKFGAKAINTALTFKPAGLTIMLNSMSDSYNDSSEVLAASDAARQRWDAAKDSKQKTLENQF